VNCSATTTGATENLRVDDVVDGFPADPMPDGLFRR
jgi:hypothetical protein